MFDIAEELKDRFPNEGERIFALAALRVMERCPFKRADYLYERTYLSEIFGKQTMSASGISRMLQEFGTKREQHVGFMKEYLKDSRYILLRLFSFHHHFSIKSSIVHPSAFEMAYSVSATDAIFRGIWISGSLST